MSYSALLLGSVGVLAETHDLQRRAFNAAFAEAGLSWEWTDPEYTEMLRTSGGRKRIAGYAEARGEEVDAEALHAAKIRHFAQLLSEEGVTPRPGIVALIKSAKDRGLRVGFVTSTGANQSGAILDAMGDAFPRAMLDFVGDASMVDAPKPAPDIYHAALDALGVDAGVAVAIEDTPVSAGSALAAGITTLGFPGIAAQGLSFPDGVTVNEWLGPDAVELAEQAA